MKNKKKKKKELKELPLNPNEVPVSYEDRVQYYTSNEEVYFSWWVDELRLAGFIDKCTYNKDVFLLSDKVGNTYQEEQKEKIKTKKESLILKHIYTPDFTIYWNEKAKGIFFGEGKQKDYPFILVKDSISYVETKGSFDANNMIRLFTINQKWLYDKEQTYINLAKVSSKEGSFFDKTFTPKMYLMTNTRTTKKGDTRYRTLGYKPKLLNSYLDDKK